MLIKYIKGNIFDPSNDKKIIAHSVNTKGVFGAGFALEISKRYPFAKQMYLNKFRTIGWHLGDIQMVGLAEKIIVNMALQDTYGRTGIHTKLDACRIAFDSLFRFSSNENFDVSMPKVGSGLGGEAWENIEKVLIECLEVYPSVNIDIYYL